MKRRESIKSIIVGSVAGGVLLQGCEPKVDNPEAVAANADLSQSQGYGRTVEEAKRDQKIMADTFFAPFEMATIAILADIIIPKDEVSGSATEAGVPDFIEFIVKDMPNLQQPIRSGLGWLNLQSKDRYGVAFKEATSEQQLAIVDEVAALLNEEDTEKINSELQPGVEFFRTFRNLTATGFFTSKMGVQDLGYEGNVANFWDGVPDDVLKEHGFTYDEVYMDQYVTLESREKLPEWDNDGNLVG